MDQFDDQRFDRVSPDEPCLLCGKPDWCLIAKDGSAAICPRTPEGAVKDLGTAGYLHMLDEVECTEADVRLIKELREDYEPVKKPRVFSDFIDAVKCQLKSTRSKHPGAKIGSRWYYKNEREKTVFFVQRFELGEADSETGKPKKKFIPFKRVDKGWAIGDPKPPFPLWNLGGIGDAERVVVTEGEKAAKALVSIGIPATTLHQFNCPEKTDLSPLKDKAVVVMPDHDDQGELSAHGVMVALHETGCGDIRMLRLPNLPPKGDAVEFIEACDTGREARKRLLQLMNESKVIDPLEFIDYLKVIRLSDVEPEEIEWLWPERIPLGKLTVLVGDPGVGKSFLTMDIAARLSTGKPWPDAPGAKQPVRSVILLSAEDDPADTIRPRLDSMEGNPEKVCVVTSVIEQGERTKHKKRERLFSLVSDIEKLERAIIQHPDCALVVIDPISAYMSGKDTHKDAEIRGVLTPLAGLAAKHRVAVVAVTHMNKNSKVDAIYRTMGSVGIVAAARAVWSVVKDPHEDTRRLLLSVKTNIARDSANGLAYAIVDGVVTWEEAPITQNAQHFLQQSDEKTEESKSSTDEIVEWLVEVLSEGPVLATEMMTLARGMAFNWRTVGNAKKKAGAVSQRVGFGEGSKVYWLLRGDEHRLPKPRKESE